MYLLCRHFSGCEKSCIPIPWHLIVQQNTHLNAIFNFIPHSSSNDKWVVQRPSFLLSILYFLHHYSICDCQALHTIEFNVRLWFALWVQILRHPLEATLACDDQSSLRSSRTISCLNADNWQGEQAKIDGVCTEQTYFALRPSVRRIRGMRDLALETCIKTNIFSNHWSRTTFSF